MASSTGELMVTVSADTSALGVALEKAHDAILFVLRRQYIAEGSPNGATPEGFDAWLLEHESLIVPRFDVADSAGYALTPLVTDPLDRFRAHLNLPRKGPPGSADDCEFCHPELAEKE